MGCTVIGTGKALPRKVVTNDDLSKIVDTSDEWIVPRTGIHTRRIAIEESATDMAAAAGFAAMGAPAAFEGAKAPETTGWNAHRAELDSIDLLICMTVTPDATIPSQASMVKAAMGLGHAVAFDLNAACSGCVYGISVAEQMMTASHIAGGAVGNKINRALVIGVERLSRIVDWTDRSTCVLFGDGAGAVLLEWNDDAAGVRSTFLKNTDDVDYTLIRSNMFDNSTFPFGDAEAAKMPFEQTNFIGMNGRAVFKFAGNALAEAANAVLERAGVAMGDVKCIVPHQANERIIRYAAKKLAVDEGIFQISIGHSANTSAASALMALCDAYCAGRIDAGDNVIMAGFGGGLTSGALLYEA